MICYCHRTTRRFEKRAELEFETKNAFLKCGKFTNSIEHYKIWHSRKSLRKSHKSLVKNNTLMINRCSGASEACLCGIVCEVGRCLDAKILTLTWSPLRWQPCLNPITPLCKLTANFASATSGDKSVGCKNIAKGTTKQSVNCAVSIFISPFILFKS